jgi:valyl-tRNA synthetase
VQVAAIIATPDAVKAGSMAADRDFLLDRGNLSSLDIAAAAAKPAQSVTTVVGALKVHIPLSGLVDLGKLKGQLEKRDQTLAKSISGKQGRLGNADYVARAPAEQVAETKMMLEREQAELANVRETLATL